MFNREMDYFSMKFFNEVGNEFMLNLNDHSVVGGGNNLQFIILQINCDLNV